MDYDVNIYSSDDEEVMRRPKIVRVRPNYFEEFDRKDFFDRFRLSPRTVENLLSEIEDIIEHPSNRNDCLSASDQLLLALNFFGNGSFLKVAGDFFGVSKSTACLSVRRVSRAIASLRGNYIKMPSTEDDVSYTKQKFYEIARFPSCIGAIDCTHVKIQSPGGENAEIFRNRKQFFSINVQTIVNSDLKIEDIVARWPGSSHDSHIFRNSQICGRFENGEFDGVIVGDSGYPIKPYLITPLLHTRNEAEVLFNESQIRTRNVVERTYGIWKRRFPCLAMGLRLNLDTTQAVIVATAILHNIARSENEEVPPLNQQQDAAINFINDVQPPNNEDDRGINNGVRYNLIQNYFANM